MSYRCSCNYTQCNKKCYYDSKNDPFSPIHYNSSNSSIFLYAILLIKTIAITIQKHTVKAAIDTHSSIIIRIHLLTPFVALRTILPRVKRNAMNTPAMIHSIKSITNPPIHSFFHVPYYQDGQLKT